MTDDELLYKTTAALVVLTEHGIEPDVQELLVYGNPSRGIAPGALRKAIQAALAATLSRS
jgi:hypothetical protein